MIFLFTLLCFTYSTKKTSIQKYKEFKSRVLDQIIKKNKINKSKFKEIVKDFITKYNKKISEKTNCNLEERCKNYLIANKEMLYICSMIIYNIQREEAKSILEELIKKSLELF